ncbi:hypothetical protein [Nocardiopsis suaedae]|uniref:Uncharacterized protein n=1 Tax=Nocardiopsis suaedae TaxID=3018444 RepID=A0ABT4TU29_9ACTN|nr:hypothetical protein [Nocardiopsis suaedae]MDA2808211.1 hypothetical protein [Nocardiopsis suaedae]
MSEPRDERPGPAERAETRESERQAWLRQAPEDAWRLRDEDLSAKGDPW